MGVRYVDGHPGFRTRLLSRVGGPDAAYARPAQICMNDRPLATAVQALGLALFQRDARGRLRLASRPPNWLGALWPSAAKPGRALNPMRSAFLQNFLVDAAACWQAGGAQRIHSGPWVERDARGVKHYLQATALTATGRATLVIEECSAVVQKARELALTHEKLQQTEKTLATEKDSLEQRCADYSEKLWQTDAALKQEIATRQRYAERLQGIHDIDKAVLAAQSPEAIAEATLRRLRHLLPCDQANVVELDANHQYAVVLASVQRGKITRGGGLLPCAPLQRSRALRSGRLLRLTGQRNLFAHPANTPADRNRRWPLIIDVPLIVDDTLLGVLNLATESPATFDAEREEMAVESAAHLAVALRQAQLFTQVAAGREQLRALSLRLVEVQEAERRFLAHELHDEIGQVLTGLKLTLEMSARPAVDAPDPGLAEAIGMVDDLMQRVRQLSLDLRPQILDDLGLLPALSWLFRRYAKQAGLRVHFRCTPFIGRLATQLETAVFRIVQEAVTNVARHAGVGEVTVRLWQDSRHRSLGVQVYDSGAGFDVQRALGARASAGLVGMRERTLLLGGQFQLDSAPGAGTRLTVKLPLTLAAPSVRALTQDTP